ncbi:MAG: outer membrane protein assembly factor BamC [Pseudomonadota bacterium]
MMLVRVFTPLLTLSLSGCGWLLGDDGVFRDPSNDYKQAPETAVIQVPEGKDTTALREIYAIPPIDESLVMAGDFEVPRPTPLVAGANAELVRIQRLGEESWALVGVAPGQLWPQVRSFLAAASIPVTRLDARAGTMETNWVPLENQPASRFQFRIERGVQRGTSELHVLQQDQAGDISRWPEGSDNLDTEQEMLRGVAQFVANNAESAPVSMIADQAISSSGKVALQEAADGHTVIALELPFNRAWASLGKALPLTSFEITDRDRSAGTYYARFLGPDAEDEEGWFDWLWGGEEEHPLAGQDCIIQMTPDGEDAVSIRLELADDSQELNLRDEQSVLALLKSNIT